ncbi:MAG: FG-GAP repeat domain-containing protein, partial [Bacteroidota bacterium]
MKQAPMFIALLLVVCAMSVPAQTYLDPTVRIVPTPADVTTIPCQPPAHRSFVFDFAPLRNGCTGLDLVVARTTWEVSGDNDDPLTYWFTYSHNNSGQFANHGIFWHGSKPCDFPVYVNKLLFGNLRPDVIPSRKDLVAIMSQNAPSIWRTQVIHNTLNPQYPLAIMHQLDINAVDGAWGAFTGNDVLEDLALTDPYNSNGPRIKIYPNNNDGTLDEVGAYVFEGYSAQKIVLAQINGPIDADLNLNKLDLIGVDGTTIKIWRNNNFNGLPEVSPYYQSFQILFGLGIIHSLAVADINNDGYNDIIVGANRGAAIYLNSADQNGWFEQTPEWSYSMPVAEASRSHLVAVGDIGAASVFGGANVNDGWNDVVIASGVRAPGEQPTIRVFVNLKGIGTPPIYIAPSPQQVFSFTPTTNLQAPCDDFDFQQIALADVQGAGALALTATLTRCKDKDLYMFLHTPQAQPWNGGWNIAAVSVTVPDYSPSAVFPQRDPNSVLYKFQGGSYVPVTGNLTSNRGYFVKFPTSQPTWPVTYTGTPI